MAHLQAAESEIQAFWEANPCDGAVLGRRPERDADWAAYFDACDRTRYAVEPHILERLDEIDLKGKRVLEIGLGQGADSEQLIRRGAIWSGVDLTSESVDRVRRRLALRQLPYDTIQQGSALALPFDANQFDVVFSHGVLHHIPDIRAAQREIRRVLKPGGVLVAMVYAKISLNYLLAIAALRRAGLAAMYLLRLNPGGIYGEHLANARAAGLWKYLRLSRFVHANTDGPLNPYSKVYTLNQVRADFPDFRVARTFKCFMHAPPLPVRRLPLERLLGWHLWVHMHARDTSRSA